jgi:hypothetical protein
MTYTLLVSGPKPICMKWISSFFVLVCYLGIHKAQAENLRVGSLHNMCVQALPDSAAAHERIPKHHFPLFFRFAAGVGSIHSSYSTELITPGSPAINITHQYEGKGYEIPFEIAAGVQAGRFRISMGLTVVPYHVAELSRQGDTLSNTFATGSPVKHQTKKFGTNYFFPLSVDYIICHKNPFELSARIGLGIYYHEMNAYTGVYAPSQKPDISGSSFTFGISPAYVCKNISYFLNPAFRLDAISYHRSTYDDLSDLSFNCSIGCCIFF